MCARQENCEGTPGERVCGGRLLNDALVFSALSQRRALVFDLHYYALCECVCSGLNCFRFRLHQRFPCFDVSALAVVVIL